VLFFVIGIALGGAIGYYAKPMAKLGAKVYLSFKENTWKQPKQEQAKIETALATVSSDPEQSVNTLVLGSDAGSNKGEGGWCRSDVMMLVCLQERDKRAVVISIPRDTKVELSGYGAEKINAAHSYSGPSGAIDAVKSLTGIDVHHYISMEFNGFKKIVDALDGVPIHLSSPINDPHAGYLPAGDLKLDGEQALVVVRSRKLPKGDVDRIGNQQAFIKALMNKAEQMKSVWKAKELVDIVAANCKMDYSAGQLMNLAEELQGFDLKNVQFVTLPGVPKYIGGVSYYVADTTLVSKLATEVKADTMISADLMATLQSPEENRRVEELNAPDADAISVLSGSKTSTWAVPTVAEELRLLGHEKVYEGKTRQPLARTTVYYRHEAEENSEVVKNTVPELADADYVLNDEIPAQYNSPVVVVLGNGFTTPSLVSIYGRMARPAFDFEDLGRKINSFG
jgi:LCP family protein required for cell wall assembly